MRLAKYLAHSGVASRRASERLIASGRVTVGDEIVTDPARDVEPRDMVAVDGGAVGPEPREVWMLNKPPGVVSTASEPGRRRAVVDLVESARRLYPVGRLDADSTGLRLAGVSWTWSSALSLGTLPEGIADDGAKAYSPAGSVP